MDVVSVHQTAFPSSTLTQMGTELVYQYYLWQFNNSYYLFPIGAYIDDHMVGFCFSGVFRDSETQFILDNKNLFFRQFFAKPKLCLNKDIQNQIITGLKKLLGKLKDRSNVQPKATSTHEKYGILSIAVDDNYQGFGIGKALISRVETNAIQSGFSYMRLSVHVDNHNAISFYLKRGWTKVLSPSGIWHGSMIKDLS